MLDQAPSPDKAMKARARKRLKHFIPMMWRNVEPKGYEGNWHIDMMCEHLEAVTRGDIRRLLINVPPKHMKSLAVSVFWPAWTWLHDASRRFLFASYAETLSIRDSVKCRRVVESPQYDELILPKFENFALTTDQNQKMRFENTCLGYRMATSVGGSLTGEGADIICVDDPHNVVTTESETVRNSVLAWWDESMSTRLHDPDTGAFVVIMQRLHEHDLSGHIMAKELGDWEHLCIPCRYEGENRVSTTLGTADPRTEVDELLWHDRFSEETIAETEESLGAYGTAGQLQQHPAPREGGLIQSHWFNQVEDFPRSVDKRVRFWDFAATKKRATNDPDWTAGVRVSIRAGQYWVEDVVRTRETPRRVEQLVTYTTDNDPPDTEVCIEEEGGASGKNMSDHYRRIVLVGRAVKCVRSTGNKEQYAEPFASAAEAGNVMIVRDATWNKAFRDECDGFPNAAHDDQVDACSKAIAQLRPKRVVGVFGNR